jgi:hypothetical protein
VDAIYNEAAGVVNNSRNVIIERGKMVSIPVVDNQRKNKKNLLNT